MFTSIQCKHDMVNVRLLLTALLSVLLVGCQSFQQVQIESANKQIRLSSNAGSLVLDVYAPKTKPQNPPKANLDTSYAVGVKGKFAVHITENVYAAKSTGPWYRYDVRLINPQPSRVDASQNSQADESTLGWQDGEWRLHVQFSEHAHVAPVDIRFKLTTSTGPNIFLLSGWPN